MTDSTAPEGRTPLTEEELDAIKALWADIRAAHTEKTSIGDMVPVDVDLFDLKLTKVLAEVDRLRTRVAEADQVALRNTETFLKSMDAVNAEYAEATAERDALAAKVEAFLKPHAIVRRNIGWTGSDGALHVAELSVCDHCVPQFKHFSSREDVPEGPCEIRRALGGDQDGGDR